MARSYVGHIKGICLRDFNMNERIRELVRQAGLDDDNFPIENWDNVPLAKFAQLIVKECISIAVAGDAKAVVTVIKERFGVEE